MGTGITGSSSRIGATFTFIAVVFGGLGLSACDNSSEAAAPERSGFDPATVAQDEKLAAEVPEALREDGVLSVGSDTTYAPAEFLGADSQTPIGYDVDLAAAIGSVLGLKTEVHSAEFAGILPSLGTKFDLGVSSYSITAKRLEAVNMVSYVQDGTSWTVQKGNPRGVDPENPCGLAVGVQTGTLQESPDLSGRNQKCLDKGDEPIDVVTLKNQADVSTRLINGGLDAMVTSSAVSSYTIVTSEGTLEKLGTGYRVAPVGITVAKEDPALATLVQKALVTLKESGAYGKILESWGVPDAAISSFEVNPRPAD